MITIEVFIRPDGVDGYVVGYRKLHGKTPISPPVNLTRFPAGELGRAQADAYKQGAIDGMRILVNAADSLIPQ